MIKDEIKEEEDQALESGNAATPPLGHGPTAGPSGTQPDAVAKLVPKLEAVTSTSPTNPVVDGDHQPTEGHMGGVQGMGQAPNVQGQGGRAPMTDGGQRQPFFQLSRANLSEVLKLAQTFQRLTTQQQQLRQPSELEIERRMKWMRVFVDWLQNPHATPLDLELQLGSEPGVVDPQPTEGHMGGVQGMGQNPNVQGQGRGAPMTDGGQPQPFIHLSRANISVAQLQKMKQMFQRLTQQHQQQQRHAYLQSEPTEGDKGGKQGIGQTPNVQGRGVSMMDGGLPQSFHPFSEAQLQKLKQTFERLTQQAQQQQRHAYSQLEMQSKIQQERQKIGLRNWLRRNRFQELLDTFSNYSWSDMMDTSREDYKEICGVAEGIRLYNLLHKSRTKPY